jgi:NADPH:quinone reductase-like Zn-dependent oxidoreductase
MKAYEVQQFGIDSLALVDRDETAARPNDVVVKFHAASLNYRDLMVVEGTYNPRMKLPAVPLSDGAGEVIAVGDAVTKWKVGDRVMPIFAQHWFDGEVNEDKRRTSLGAGSYWDGVLRESAVFNEEGLVRIPDHLSYEEASTLPCAALTAWHALTVSGKVKAGDTVLTLGTGGVSIFALQLAKLLGARVISTTGNEEKVARLKEHGADDVINYRTHEDWDKQVLELTSKRGVDHVIEVGGTGTLARSVRAVRMAGHIAMIGALSTANDFNPIALFMKSVRLQGIFVGSRVMFEDLLKKIDEAKLEPVIDRVFEFSEAREAMHYMKSGAHFGKVVIRIG